jgi:type IV secretion system protein VirD4
MMFWGRNKHSTSQGTAEFSRVTGVTPTGENLIFGRLLGGSFRYPYVGIEPEKHALTVAGTRGGKGTTLIINNLLTYRGSVVVIDPKGENAAITARARAAMGQNVLLLDPWGVVEKRYGEDSFPIASYNILEELDINSSDYVDDLTYKTNALILKQSQDPHWDNSARALLSGLIDFSLRKGWKDISNVRQILCLPNLVPVASEALNNMPGDSIACRRLSQFLQDDSRENNSILSSARQQTLFIDSPILANNMSGKSTFKMEDLTREATLYIVLPVDKITSYGRWLRLLLSDIIKTLARHPRTIHPKPVMFLDEFGTIGALEPIRQAYGLMAGLNMFLWVFLQDLNQLSRDYPNDWRTFISNSQAVSIYSAMDLKTGQHFAEMLGRKTMSIPSTTYSRHPGELLGSKTGKTFSYQGRHLMTADEIRMLPSDEGLLMTSGYNTKFKKNPYYLDKALMKLARKDPHYN